MPTTLEALVTDFVAALARTIESRVAERISAAPFAVSVSTAGPVDCSGASRPPPRSTLVPFHQRDDSRVSISAACAL
jgi:hypothetical protein